MMRICTVLLLLCLSVPLHAEEADCKNLTVAKVDGLVCDFCAQSLEKIFGKEKSVDRIEVDLGESEVRIFTKPGQTISHEAVTKAIEWGGYTARDIKAGC